MEKRIRGLANRTNESKLNVEISSAAERRRSASRDDQFLDAKRGGVALVLDDFANERSAAAAAAACAAGACDLAARAGARAHDFSHGSIGNAFALADEHLRVSSE